MRDLFSVGDGLPTLDTKDRLLALLMTLVYTLFTLINLGTLSFPQTVWTASAGDRATLELDGEHVVHSVLFNGNIAVGKMELFFDDGGTYEYSQQYGEMFTWRDKVVDHRTQKIELLVTSGTVSLNEIALYDDTGALISVKASGGGGAANLTDEQNTIPEAPSYYNGMYFDEIYHARTSYEFIHGMSVYEWTHPPLGKSLISLGIRAFGMTPFGWRVVPALFGALMLPILFVFGKRLFRRRDYAFLSAALFGLDTMHFTQTRIATVDVFIVFFILLMFLFMTDYIRLDNEGQPLKKALIPLGACGVSFGLGVASKWTGLYAGAGLAVLFFTHLFVTLHRCGSKSERRVWADRAWKTVVFCCVFFLLIPALIYYSSYTPFYRYETARRAVDHLSFRQKLKILVDQQKSMFSYHSKLTATHICQSTWYEWPFTAVSVWYYFRSGDGVVSNISSTGSPAVWWLACIGMLWLLMEILFGRMKNDEPTKKVAAWILLAAVAANYFPWMLVPRCTFQYHFFPTAPFMILCALLLLQHLEERHEIRPRLKWIWLGIAAVYFLLLFPVCSGVTVPRVFAQFLEYVLPTGNLFHGTV